MLGGAAFFGIVTPVPGCQIAVDAVLVQHRLETLGIGKRRRARRGPDPHQKVAHRSGCFGHFGFQFVVGETGVAQQRRAFMAQVQNFGGDGAIVGLAATRTARSPGDKCLFTQVAARRELQERHDQRPRGGDDRRLGAFLGPRRARRIDDKTWQPVKVTLVQRHEPVALVGQKVLGKRGAQDRQPGFDCLQSFGSLAFQLRTGTHEIPAMEH